VTEVRIVAFAYACEPGSGSEPGAGWMWARLLANLGETWVITRENNRAAIEDALPATPEAARLHFVYVDLPPWARWWKRGLRGVHAYYVLWQFAALRRARALHKELPFDLAWHLTFANAWIGSAASLLETSFVYGPVGGGVKTPWRLFPALGVRGSFQELVRIAVRGAARYANPLARLSWNRADLILVQNPETRAWLPARHRARATVFPNAVVDADIPRGPRRASDRKTALFAARLVAWKGGSLAIRAIARLPDWDLVVVGSGPDARRLRDLADRLHVADRVTFTGSMPRGSLLALMARNVDALLHPSVHEDAGWAIAEARSLGVPVVALELGGPPELGAIGARVGSFNETVAALASALVDRSVAGADGSGFDVGSRSARLVDELERSGLVDDDRRRRIAAD
jgi:glycosyltransferase involved in cell wall biosynthesis